MKKNLKYIYVMAISLIIPVGKVLAAYGLDVSADVAKLPKNDLPSTLGLIAGAALALAGSIFLFLIIYGGIMIMTSAGSDRLKKGKDIVTWAIIGALLLGGAYAITSLIFGIFAGGDG